MASVRITTPSALLVTLDDLKVHCHIDESAEDANVEKYIKAAIDYCEKYSNSQFINATFKRLIPFWPQNGIAKIFRGPLVSVQSIQYVDSDGDLQTWDSSNYQVVSLVSPGQLGYIYSTTTPSHRSQPQAIIINYTAGYGTTATVPNQAVQAVSMLAAHWYANRETVVVGTISGEIAFSTHALLDQISFASFSEDS